MMSTPSIAMMIAPMMNPPISPDLTALVLGETTTGLAVVFTRAVGVGLVAAGQSGSLRVSREALQLLSRCRRVERTVMEAEPVDTHD